MKSVKKLFRQTLCRHDYEHAYYRMHGYGVFYCNKCKKTITATNTK